MYDDCVARVPGGESRGLPRNSSARLRGHYHGRDHIIANRGLSGPPPDSRAATKNAPIVNSARPVSSSVGQPTHLAPTFGRGHGHARDRHSGAVTSPAGCCGGYVGLGLSWRELTIGLPALPIPGLAATVGFDRYLTHGPLSDSAASGGVITSRDLPYPGRQT
jgi:hypothetical protein